MRTLLIASTFFLFYNPIFSQNWQWVEPIATQHEDNGYSICTDAAGNNYTAGQSQGQFIVKRDISGNIIWNKHYSGYEFFGIVIDQSENLYAIGDRATFLTKLNSDGDTLWTRNVNAFAAGISISSSSKILITGNCYNDTVLFGSIMLTGPGPDYGFIAEYDTSGTCLWAKYIPTWYSKAVTVDNGGNCVVTGEFYGTVLFDSFSITAMGWGGDIFIAKYDTSGNCLWAKRAGSSNFVNGFSFDMGRAITVDPNNNILVTGQFIDTADFGNINLLGHSVNNVFITKLDPSGNFLWAKAIIGSSDCEGRSILYTSSNHILVGGSYVPNALFGGSFLLTGWGNYDAFIAKYDTNGNFISVMKAGGAVWNEFVYGLCENPPGNIFACGSYSSPAVFGNFTPTYYQDYRFDLFTAKIDITASIENKKNDDLFSVYPNPTSDILNIHLSSIIKNDLSINITDVYGRILKVSQFYPSNETEIKIDISELTNGIYFVELKSDGMSTSKKVVKTQ